MRWLANSLSQRSGKTAAPRAASFGYGQGIHVDVGVFAEFEDNLRRERQMEGVNAAKARGRLQGPQAQDQV